MGREHRLGVACRKAAAGVGGAGLHQHRPALRTAWQIERPGHLIVLALVLDRPDAVGLGIAPAGAIIDDRVLGPAVPQCLDHGHELLAALVALGVAHLADVPVVGRRRRQPRRHDVPADAPVADVIERAELARQVERLGIGG